MQGHGCQRKENWKTDRLWTSVRWYTKVEQSESWETLSVSVTSGECFQLDGIGPSWLTRRGEQDGEEDVRVPLFWEMWWYKETEVIVDKMKYTRRYLGRRGCGFWRQRRRKGDFDLKQERLRKYLLEICDEQEGSSREKGLWRQRVRKIKWWR